MVAIVMLSVVLESATHLYRSLSLRDGLLPGCLSSAIVCT